MKAVISVLAFILVCDGLVGCSSCKQSDGESPLSPEDSTALNIPSYQGYNLVWHEEFSTPGRLDSTIWSYEHGFVRNEELQWYQANNTTVHDGCMDIEGRVERVINPRYEEDSQNWKTNRPTAEYTSSCVTTKGTEEFQYGRFEVRAKIPAVSGSWPAIWLLGNKWGWPESGEIDVMEYYIKYGGPGILANACWGSEQPHNGTWDEGYIPFTHFTEKDSLWADKFHVWRLDWDSLEMNIYLDDELMNKIDLNETFNKGVKDNYENPFRNNAAYLLFDLALGGNGGIPDDSKYPIHYLVDYVRVYQKE